MFKTKAKMVGLGAAAVPERDPAIREVLSRYIDTLKSMEPQ